MTNYTKSELVGYARKEEQYIKLGINLEALEECPKIIAKDGQHYVYLHIKKDKLNAIINQDKEVTGVVSLTGSE